MTSGLKSATRDLTWRFSPGVKILSMKQGCAVKELPECLTVPHIRDSTPRAEIDRCRELLRWLESLSVEELLQPSAPVVNDDLISVVVPMYNASRWIESCLKGLLAQTHSNLEIFCVDDASEDDTYRRVVEQFGRDRRLVAIRLGLNVGPYQIKNWVIRSLARAGQVALQDADDISHPLRLEEQRKWMVNHRYRISGTCMHQFFPSHINPRVRTSNPVEVEGMSHNIAHYPNVERTQEPVNLMELLKHRRHLALEEGDAGVAINGGLTGESEASFPNNPAASAKGPQIFDRELFLEFGGFDGHARMSADTDFNWRVLRFHSIGNIPKVLYSRRIHENSITQHPLTGYKSPARRKYRRQRELSHEAIRQELVKGNVGKVRKMCTADLFCDDIRVEEYHPGFDLVI